MSTMLVTGGAGFIGFHLAKYLLKRKQKVIVYDCFNDYYSPKLKWENASDLQKLGAKIVSGDILDKKKLQKTLQLEKPEVILHLAAQPGVRYSTQNPAKVMKINVEGTTNVLEQARQCDVRRVVVTSSSSVFGKTQYMPIDEKHPTNPISYYGVTKLTAEQLVHVTNHLYPELETVIIRPFTVVGARQRPDMAINTFVSKAMQNEEITIYGDGTQTRDWTHCENMAQAFYLAAIKAQANHETFNVGAGTRISVNKVLEIVEEITGQELVLTYANVNKADAKDTFADITKAKMKLGYKPKRTLKDAIIDFTNYWNDKNKPRIFSKKIAETTFSSMVGK